MRCVSSVLVVGSEGKGFRYAEMRWRRKNCGG